MKGHWGKKKYFNYERGKPILENEIKNHEIEKQVLADAEEILNLKAKLDVIIGALNNFVHKESAATHIEVITKGLDNNDRRGHLYTTSAEELIFVLDEILSFCGVPEMGQYISRVGCGSTISSINPQELSLRCFVALRGVRSPREKIMIQSPNVRYIMAQCTDAGLNRKEAFFVLVTMVLNSFSGLSRYLSAMHPLFPLLGPLLAVTSSHYDKALFYPFSLRNEEYLLKKTFTPLRTKNLASSLLLSSLELMTQEQTEKLHKAFLTPCVVDLEEYTKVLQGQLSGTPFRGKFLACVKGVPLSENLAQHDRINVKLKPKDEYLLEEDSYTVSQNMDTVYFSSTWGAPLANSLILKDAKDYCKEVLDAISFDVIDTSHKNLAFISKLESMPLSNGRRLVPFETEMGLKRLSVKNMHDPRLLIFRHDD